MLLVVVVMSSIRYKAWKLGLLFIRFLVVAYVFSEDFAQFASNFRWRIQARDSRAQRLPLNESRLRTRRFRGRHIPYTQLWDRVPPVASRPDSLLADIADFAPRPGPSADSNSPIVIEDEVKSSWTSFTLDTYKPISQLNCIPIFRSSNFSKISF